jgi:hypothetical protein
LVHCCYTPLLQIALVKFVKEALSLLLDSTTVDYTLVKKD